MDEIGRRLRTYAAVSRPAYADGFWGLLVEGLPHALLAKSNVRTVYLWP